MSFDKRISGHNSDRKTLQKTLPLSLNVFSSGKHKLMTMQQTTKK